jgi:lipoyl(octanoyl) transferase
LDTLTVAWLGTVEYLRALQLQNGLVGARLRDEVRDVLLLLEHPHVYTLGRGADERFVLDAADLPVHRVSRGGQVTYHGPGQLIGYPIVKLADGQRDVIRYLRQLEQVVIETLATVGIAGQRLSGLTGVWVGQEKIASIGVGFRRWVSLHGFALNVSTDLSYFDAIVPCGIRDCRMTSIAARGLRTISCEAAGQIVAGRFATVFGYERTVWEEEGQIFATVDARARSCDARK